MVADHRDDLLRKLSLCVSRFKSSADPRAVLAPEVLDLVCKLTQAVPDPTSDREAAWMLAAVYRARSLVLDGEPSRSAQAISEAMELLAHAHGDAGSGAGTESAFELWERANELTKVAEANPDLARVEAAEAAVRAALSAQRHGYFHAELGARLAELLRESYRRSGGPPLLDRAVEMYRDAEAASGERHARRASIVNGLGISLRERFERTSALADLDEAVHWGREALSLTSEADFNFGGRLSNLGIALRLRYQRTGARQDLQEALQFHERAVSVTPKEHPGYHMFRASLAHARETAGAEATAREVALTLYEETADAASLSGPAYPMHLADLGRALSERYDATGSSDDADRSELLLRRSMADSRLGPSHRGMVEFNLARLLVARSVRSQDTAYAVSAAASYRSVRDCTELATSVRVQAARLGAALHAALGDGRGAVEAYAVAVGLLPTLVEGDQHDAQDALSEFAEVPCEAAAAALDAGDPIQAWALLEQGRGLLFGRAAASGSSQKAQHHDLRALAGDGPLAIINVSQARCDALVVERNILHVLPLPELSRDELSSMAIQLQAAWTVGEQDSALRQVMSRLWQTVVLPVLRVLRMDRPPLGPRLPRLWWMPTGPLASLPLHAAGGAAPSMPSLLDYAVSSYVTSIHGLERARRPLAATRAQCLLVSAGQVPGLSSLPGVARESALMHQILPDLTLRADADATRESVLKRLPEHAWFHFAGHGSVDPQRPLASRLVLHDHAERPLTVTDICSLDLQGAELAYLSACATAQASPALADQGLHLAGALQAAGFRQVVGTLWPVQDNEALALTERFYRSLAAAGPGAHHAAYALHAAVCAARRGDPDRPSRWAGAVHFGP